MIHNVYQRNWIFDKLISERDFLQFKLGNCPVRNAVGVIGARERTSSQTEKADRPEPECGVSVPVP